MLSTEISTVYQAGNDVSHVGGAAYVLLDLLTLYDFDLVIFPMYRTWTSTNLTALMPWRRMPLSKHGSFPLPCDVQLNDFMSTRKRRK